MRQLVLSAVSAVAITLSACGGGGGSSPAPPVSVTPTPTPTPSAAPTATPTPASLNTGEVKPAPGATFISATMELDTSGGYSQTNGIITGGATSGRTVILDTPQFTGTYDAGYRLSDAVNTATFGSAQVSLDSTSINGNGIVLFTSASNVAADYLALYQATTYTSSVKGMGYTAARYGGAGGWQHTVGNGANAHTRLDYFAYGSATPASAMPKSGVVHFTILRSGNYATDTDLWFLPSGSSEILTVDFGAGTVAGTISISGENFFKNEVGGVGSFPVNASINGNVAIGSFSNAPIGPSANVPGQFRILFVGPNANELVITFVAMNASRAAVGAGVGVVDPFR